MARGKNEGSIFKDGRGLWTAVVELPSYDGVTRRRKVVRSKDKKTVLRKLADLRSEKEKSGGDLPTRDMTVAQWMDEWFTTVCVKEVRPKTANNYKSLIGKYIKPVIGTVKLNRLTPTDVRRMNDNVTGLGKSSTTARQVHRILSVALKQAESDGKVSRNVGGLVKPPKKAVPDIRALTLEEAIQVLATALGDPYESLWITALFLGLREGELCGLELDRIGEKIEISWQLQRLTWQHGCSPQCTFKFGSHCKDRKMVAPADYELRHVTGGLWFTRPKSKSGWRTPPLAEPIASSIARQIERDQEIPNPHNLLWRRADGRPIDPRDLQDMWHDLLNRAGVPKVRFHDARHTAVDLWYEAGVSESDIVEIMGHSTRAVTRSYKSRGNHKSLTASMHQVVAMVTRG